MDVEAAWNQSIATLLSTSHLAQPSALADVVHAAVDAVGAEVTILLADREQVSLRPLLLGGKASMEALDVDGSVAGRAFRTMSMVISPHDDRRVWVPILDGTERLGALEVHLPADMSGADPIVHSRLAALTVLIGHLLVAKAAYGDTLRRARRSQPMSVAGELLWRMMPPLTFATDNMILAAIIEPCYDVGGDAFDYAVDDDKARISIYDALGHDLQCGDDLHLDGRGNPTGADRGGRPAETARAADDALMAQFQDMRYATAVLAELDLNSGLLRIVNAGHTSPVVLRSGRSVATIDGGRRLPLGSAATMVR